MRILAIESSAVTASVAILTDDCLTAEYTVNYKKTHSQTLLPMIDEICKMTEIDLETVDLIAVSVGPGSFTGLRIGAATGKGLALAVDKPMVAVPTLLAMAYNFANTGCESLICPVMDAKRNHVYTALYRLNAQGIPEEISGKQLVSIEDLVKDLNQRNKTVLFVGDGIGVAKNYFDANLQCAYRLANPALNTQRAASVALAAKDMDEQGMAIAAGALHPDYLRPSQAERELQEKQAK